MSVDILKPNKDRANKKISGKFSSAPRLPLINPGIYEATIVNWELHQQYDRMKILVHIVVDTGVDLTRLTHFVSVKMNKDGTMREPTPTMKLYRLLKNLWSHASFADIDLDELINKRCKVVVDTVKRDSQRQEKPSEKWYSAIREILSLECEHKKVPEPWEEDDLPA